MIKVKLRKGESLLQLLMRYRTIREKEDLQKDVDLKEIKNIKKVKGVCYRPRWVGGPTYESTLRTSGRLEADIEWASEVAEAIRTYSSTDNLASIPELCEKSGIDCYAGAWLGRDNTENANEIERIIRIGNVGSGVLRRTKALIVGSEVLHRRDMTEEGLIEYIREVKKSVTLPVSTAETWRNWTDHPKLAQDVDFLMVHIYPYLESCPIDKAAAYVLKTCRVLKSMFPGKKVIVGQTGWPSKGQPIEKAVASEENQARFLMEFAALSERTAIEYFLFGFLPMLEVQGHPDMSPRHAMERFKELCEKQVMSHDKKSGGHSEEGLIRNMKRTAYYEKPAEKKRRRMRRAQRLDHDQKLPPHSQSRLE